MLQLIGLIEHQRLMLETISMLLMCLYTDLSYYNYYISCYSYSLSRVIAEGTNSMATEQMVAFWPQTIPNLIGEDPPGRRPLFDAVVAYTASLRHEAIPIDFNIYSTGDVARLAELGIKSYIDITRGTSETLAAVETFFQGEDPIRLIFRWGILQHTIVQILGDAQPRVEWVNLLVTKICSTSSYQASSTLQSFYVEALRHISSGSRTIPKSLADLRLKYDFLGIPGVDLIYFAFISDMSAVQNICYHILSNPRMEFLYLAGILVNGARIRGEQGMDALAADLDMAARNCN